MTSKIKQEVKPKTRNQRFRELESAYDNDLFATTIETAKDYLKDHPDSILARLYLGISLYEYARYEEAKVELRKVIKDCQPDVLYIPLCHMGHLYKLKGDYKNAAAWYRRASESYPSYAGCLIFLGSILALQGKLSEAEECHRKATKCKSGDIAEAYLNLGMVIRAQGRYAEALKCFEKALRIAPKYKAAKHEIKDLQKVLEIIKRK